MAAQTLCVVRSFLKKPSTGDKPPSHETGSIAMAQACKANHLPDEITLLVHWGWSRYRGQARLWWTTATPVAYRTGLQLTTALQAWTAGLRIRCTSEAWRAPTHRASRPKPDGKTTLIEDKVVRPIITNSHRLSNEGRPAGAPEGGSKPVFLPGNREDLGFQRDTDPTSSEGENKALLIKSLD